MKLFHSSRPTDFSVADLSEEGDEEGLVASGSASESNNSGTDDPSPSNQCESKKKSAYSMAPNRVSCPYCQRVFPWSSSLRRHILTHTGQKPFKVSEVFCFRVTLLTFFFSVFTLSSLVHDKE